MADELVTVRSYFNQADAYLARSRLEADGIQAFLTDENMVNTNWFYSIAIGGMRLQVHRDDLERAVEILGDQPEKALRVEERDEVHCPKCGSTNVWRGYGVFLRWLYPLVLFLCSTVFPPPIVKWTWRCRDCGHRWRKRNG